MPTYQYACTECGEPLEVVQKFSDDSLTECPACSGRLRKIFSPAAIVFRGSGFYRNDSRKGSGSGGSTTPAKETAKKDDTKTETKTEAKKESTSDSSSSTSSSSKTSSSSSGSSEKVA